MVIIFIHFRKSAQEERDEWGAKKLEGRKPARNLREIPLSRSSWLAAFLGFSESRYISWRAHRVSDARRRNFRDISRSEMRGIADSVLSEHPARVDKKCRFAFGDFAHYRSAVRRTRRRWSFYGTQFYIKRAILRDARKRESRITLPCLQSFRDHTAGDSLEDSP